MTSEDIISKIRLLKASKDKIFTNSTIFFQKYPCKNWNVLESEKSLIVVISEQEIKRIIFYTLDFKDLKKNTSKYKGQYCYRSGFKKQRKYEKRNRRAGI